MTTFSYTSGNPANLVGGTNANMADISGPFADVTTFVNGNITDTNITPNSLTAASLATSAKPVTILGQYRVITEANFLVSAGNSAGTRYAIVGTTAFSPLSGGAGSGDQISVCTITPADFAVSPLTTRFRVVATTLVNGTAPTGNYTFGLHPVASVGGASGAIAIVLSAAVSGSTVTRATPAANSLNMDASADFAIATPGVYAFGMVMTTSIAINSAVTASVRLEVHHV